MPEPAATGRSKWFWRIVAFAAIVEALRQVADLASDGVYALIPGLMICTTLYGVLSYAFGLRTRLLTFWRVFALYCSLRTMMWVGSAVVDWIVYAQRTQESLIRLDVAIGLAELILWVLLAVALLRYAQLLGKSAREPQTYEQIFA